MTMQTTAALLLLLLLLAAAPAHPVTLEEIPNPRPADWSVDLTGSIPPAVRREIDRLGDEVKAKTGAEIAVVVVGSLHGAPAHDFAVRLFNAKGIGDRTRNDGVLVFAALDDHDAEIVLGSGIDNEQSRRTSREIMQSEMIPLFRAGDPGLAVLTGARSCAERILNVMVLSAGAAAAPAPLYRPAAPSIPPVVPQTAAPQSVWSDSFGILVWLLIALFPIGLVVFIVWILKSSASSPAASWRSSSRSSPSFLSSGLTSFDSSSSPSSSSSSDSGFSGGQSDGGGASGHW
jgi:uncharacterized protein